MMDLLTDVGWLERDRVRAERPWMEIRNEDTENVFFLLILSYLIGPSRIAGRSTSGKLVLALCISSQ